VTAAEILRRLLRTVADEADRNPEFAERVLAAVGRGAASARQPAGNSEPRARRGGRRAPGVLDPFAVYRDGETELRHRLGQLVVDQLKDIVSEPGMDPSMLALKWRTTDRLIDLVVTTVAQRAQKGDAFRTR
jgi:hypothetical protein